MYQMRTSKSAGRAVLNRLVNNRGSSSTFASALPSILPFSRAIGSMSTTTTQVNGQPSHDMTVEVKPNEDRFKVGGSGHGPALPRR